MNSLWRSSCRHTVLTGHVRQCGKCGFRQHTWLCQKICRTFRHWTGQCAHWYNIIRLKALQRVLAEPAHRQSLSSGSHWSDPVPRGQHLHSKSSTIHPEACLYPGKSRSCCPLPDVNSCCLSIHRMLRWHYGYGWQFYSWGLFFFFFFFACSL